MHMDTIIIDTAGWVRADAEAESVEVQMTYDVADPFNPVLTGLVRLGGRERHRLERRVTRDDAGEVHAEHVLEGAVGLLEVDRDLARGVVGLDAGDVAQVGDQGAGPGASPGGCGPDDSKCRGIGTLRR